MYSQKGNIRLVERGNNKFAIEILSRTGTVLTSKAIYMSDRNVFLAKENFAKDLVPYQNTDLAREGRVKFIPAKDFYAIYKNRREYYQAIKNANLIYFGNTGAGRARVNCVADLTSDIDIHRMTARTNPALNYKYLIQVSSEALHSLKNIDKIIGKYCTSGMRSFFVFNVADPQSVVDYLPVSDNVDLLMLGDRAFITKLDAMIAKGTIEAKHKIGIIFEFNRTLNFYLPLLTEIASTPLTLDTVIEFERNKIRGASASKLEGIYARFQSMLKYYDARYYDANFDVKTDCKLNLQSLLNYKTMIAPECVEYNKRCFYNKLRVHDIHEKNQHVGSDIVSRMCGLSHCFSSFDIYSDSPDCEVNIGAHFQHPSTLLKLEQLGLNISALTKQYNYNYDALEYFMPEWFDALMHDDMQRAFDSRPLLLSPTSIGHNLRECSKVFRADPFIKMISGLIGVQWDDDINKMVVECALERDFIFPIRLIVKEKQIGSYYSPIENINDELLLGSLCIPASGSRSGGQTRIYNTFFYYDFNPSLFGMKLLNYRGNSIHPGHVNENYRIFYLELNCIKYYHEDMHLSKELYIYAYDTENYFVSKYTKSEIKARYQQLSAFKNIDIDVQILNKLTPVLLEKDENTKAFYFKY